MRPPILLAFTALAAPLASAVLYKAQILNLTYQDSRLGTVPRQYRLWAPVSDDSGEQPRPLLLAFHGQSGSTRARCMSQCSRACVRWAVGLFFEGPLPAWTAESG